MTAPVASSEHRVDMLDYCRGIMACAVTVYHCDHIGGQSWAYVHPLNQLFLFVLGVGTGGFAHDRIWLSSRTGLLLAAGGAGLAAMAVFYSGAELITGWRRFALSGLCVLLGLACVTAAAPRRGVLTAVLGFLGVISYSLYLLHPVAFRVAQVAFELTRRPLAPAVAQTAPEAA